VGFVSGMGFESTQAVEVVEEAIGRLKLVPWLVCALEHPELERRFPPQ